VRGTWAEVQLGGILEQMLTLDQWDKNVCVKEGSSERVECAIRLPGSRDERGRCMWLPIDSKFPTEDYARLQIAAEAGDSDAVQTATDALLRALRAAAKDIADKYVNPPATTDYAIMFLATEGLYAEALRQPQFVEEMQQKYRAVIAGPTTLSAILSSLRMGFQTLVVEQRAAESVGGREDGIWEVRECVGPRAETVDHCNPHDRRDGDEDARDGAETQSRGADGSGGEHHHTLITSGRRCR
jgi:DNA recombination protein RmuC